MSLLGLANELLLIVADNLALVDLNPLFRTNRRLASLLESSLYARHNSVVCQVGLDEEAEGIQCTGTPLIWAAQKGYERVAALLLQKGADIAAQDDDGRTGLHLAAACGHVHMVDLLLQHGAPIECRDEDGRTPFGLAALFGERPVMELLLSRGVDINAQDTCLHSMSGCTPLHYAISKGAPDIVQFLLLNGADATVTDQRGRTALRLAIAQMYGSKDGIIKILLERTNIGYGGRLEVFHDVVAGGMETAVDLLLRQGVDVNVVDTKGATALHLAAGKGLFKITQNLINQGADVGLRDHDGGLAVHWAAAAGYSNIMSLLLTRLPAVETQDHKGRTPLYRAVEAAGSSGAVNGVYESIVRQLLDAGANPLTPDLGGKIALHVAAENGHVRICRRLLSNGLAVRSINLRDLHSRTALYWAIFGDRAMKRDGEAVKLLLKNGADINAQDEHGHTALHIAASVTGRGNPVLVKLLVESGIDIRAVTSEGRTAMQDVVLRRNFVILKVLLQTGGAAATAQASEIFAQAERDGDSDTTAFIKDVMRTPQSLIVPLSRKRSADDRFVACVNGALPFRQDVYRLPMKRSRSNDPTRYRWP